MRKVRASQSRVAVNGSRRRLQGECNRNIPHCFYSVRVERRGKSSPGCGRSHCHVNPIRSNTVTAEGGRRPVAPFGARANGLCGLNRRATGGLDRLSSQQNPAYQPTHDKREEPFGSSLLYFPPFSPRAFAGRQSLHPPCGRSAPRPGLLSRVEKVGKDTPGTSWFLDLRHKGADPLGFPRLLP